MRHVIAVLALMLAPTTSQASPRPANWTDAVTFARNGAEHHVSPDGKPAGDGTETAPWDLASVLAGKQKVAPGDIIWVASGAYRGKFEAALAGKADAPVHFCAKPGQRATIMDSGLVIGASADYLWFWGLEICSSVPVEKRQTQQTGSSPTDLPAGGSAGLEIRGGKGCRYIGLVIHDNVGSGVDFWKGATDSEMLDCIIFDNGWRAPDRGHGHCIYTQNETGTKTIANCIMSVPFDGSYTMHAYGSSAAFVDNYVIEGNIAYGKGPFLIGGGRPSHNIKVSHNCLFGVPMRLGYGAQNEDCVVRDNIVPGGLTIEKFKKVVDEGNVKEMPAASAIIIPSGYDRTRAHVAVYNGSGAREVTLDTGDFLKAGDAYRLLNAQDFFGKPVLEGVAKGNKLSVPMKGPFSAFVLVKAIK